VGPGSRTSSEVYSDGKGEFSSKYGTCSTTKKRKDQGEAKSPFTLCPRYGGGPVRSLEPLF